MRGAIPGVLAAGLMAAVAGAANAPAASEGCARHVRGAYGQAPRPEPAPGRAPPGDRLPRARGGPPWAAADRVLPPLLYAAGRGGTPLTASGVYYLPFTLPTSVGGARGFGL